MARRKPAVGLKAKKESDLKEKEEKKKVKPTPPGKEKRRGKREKKEIGIVTKVLRVLFPEAMEEVEVGPLAQQAVDLLGRKCVPKQAQVCARAEVWRGRCGSGVLACSWWEVDLGHGLASRLSVSRSLAFLSFALLCFPFLSFPLRCVALFCSAQLSSALLGSALLCSALFCSA